MNDAQLYIDGKLLQHKGGKDYDRENNSKE